MRFKLSFFLCLVDVLFFILLAISTNMSLSHNYELLNDVEHIWVKIHWPISILAKYVIDAGYHSNSYGMSLFFYVNGYSLLFVQTFCVVFLIDNMLFKARFGNKL